MQNAAPAVNATTLRGRALAIALLAAAALFMENLDSTIITTGLPTMARQFGVTAVSLNVGVTAYLVTLAVFIPVSGWMANRFGERHVFAGAVLAFTLASVLCGVSRTLPQFLLARILQGLGGSMMVPVGRLMVIRAVSKPQLMRAVAYTIWPALAAPILGPVVGGYILHVASWPWMFLLNVPIGLLLFVLALRLVRNSEQRPREPFDRAGFLLIGAACLAFMTALELLASPAGHLFTLGVFGSGCAALSVGAFCHLRRARHPLFDLNVFQLQSFRTVMGAGSLFRMAVFSVPFLLPLLFQTSFGLDPLRSGSLTMAVFAGNLGMKPLTTTMLRRFGFRRVLLVNGLITVGLLAGCGWLSSSTPAGMVFLILFLGGAGRSMELTSLTTLGFADLPSALTGSGTTLATMVQQMTVSAGIAVAAAALQISGHFAHGTAARTGDFRVAFCTMAALAATSLVSFRRLPEDAGAAVSGHAPGRAAHETAVARV